MVVATPVREAQLVVVVGHNASKKDVTCSVPSASGLQTYWHKQESKKVHSGDRVRSRTGS